MSSVDRPTLGLFAKWPRPGEVKTRLAAATSPEWAARVPPIFEGIAWGGSRVLAATVKRVSAAGLRLALLPPWYDVDTLEDWHMLRGHIMALRAAGKEPGVSHAEALLGLGPPERLQT